MAIEWAGRIERGPWPGQPGADHGLAWHVGDAVLGRARSVLARGCVLTCEQVAPGQLSATVGGTRPWPYQVGVVFVMAGGRVGAFEGDCDCPVELDCKHAVAALLHHLGRLAGAPASTGRAVSAVPHAPDWEVSLTQLLGASLKPPAELDRVHTPLALQVAVAAGPVMGAFGTAGIRIRPIQYNARNRWVSSGVSWRDLRYGYYTAHYQPQQLEAVRGIADLELRRHPQQALGTWISGDGPGGSQLWDALADAQQAGVDLLLEGAHTAIELTADPAEVALDLIRGDTLRLTPIVRLGRQILDPATTQLLGRPAHAVVIGWPADRPAPHPVSLARLRRPLTAELEPLTESGSIPIPPTGETRFLTDYLPTLRRRITVLCSDGSVDIPEPLPPRPVLTVSREPGHLIRLHWQWEEESGRRRGFTDRRGLPASDREAMRRAVAALLAPGLLPPALAGLRTGRPGAAAAVPAGGQGDRRVHDRGVARAVRAAGADHRTGGRGREPAVPVGRRRSGPAPGQ